MCGILGLISNKKIDKEKAIYVLNGQKHRGPDNTSYHYSSNYFIGHNRLSILDLSKNGNQPFISNCGNYILSFNGEIYNYNEIRKILINKGYQFISNSDTEVLLYGYVEFKDKILSMIDGIFAFIIYDKRNDEIFIARDHFGVKPLYYLESSDLVVIASEIKTIKNYSNKINFEGYVNFLATGSISEPSTILKNVKSLPQGSCAIIKNLKFKIKKYYQFNNNLSGDSSFNINPKELKNLIIKSISSQLISDAPIGIFLSGGIDSSVITAYASKINNKINTISLTFSDGYSEGNFQKTISQAFKTNHHEIKIGEKEFLDSYLNFIESIDQPTVDGFNTFFVSKATKELGIKCALSGIGSDEIFYGYPSFNNVLYLKNLRKFNFLINSRLLNGKYKKLDYLKCNFPHNIYLPSRSVFSILEISEILGLEEKEIIRIIDNIFELDKIQTNNELSIIDHFEFNHYMKNQLLRDSDIFGMYNSVEIRVPFLSKDLVEFSKKIMPNKKVSKKYNKNILVDTVKDDLPSEIYNRTKKGFELPYKKWISQNYDILKIDKKTERLAKNNKWHWSKLWAINILNNYN